MKNNLGFEFLDNQWKADKIINKWKKTQCNPGLPWVFANYCSGKFMQWRNAKFCWEVVWKQSDHKFFLNLKCCHKLRSGTSYLYKSNAKNILHCMGGGRRGGFIFGLNRIFFVCFVDTLYPPIFKFEYLRKKKEKNIIHGEP